MGKKLFLKKFFFVVIFGLLSVLLFSIKLNILETLKLNPGEIFIFISVIVLDTFLSFLVLLFAIVYFLIKLNFFFAIFLFFEWLIIVYIYKKSDKNFLYSFFFFWLIFAPSLYILYFFLYKKIFIYAVLNRYFFRFFLCLIQLLLAYPFAFIGENNNTSKLNLKLFLIYFSIFISTASLFLFMKLYILPEITNLKIKKKNLCVNEVNKLENGLHIYIHRIEEELNTLSMIYVDDKKVEEFSKFCSGINFFLVENVFKSEKIIFPFREKGKVIIPEGHYYKSSGKVEFLIFDGYLFVRSNKKGGYRFTLCVNFLTYLEELRNRFYLKNFYITDEYGKFVYVSGIKTVAEKKFIKICKSDSILPITVCSYYSKEKLYREESIFIFKYFIFGALFLLLSLLLSLMFGNLLFKPFDNILKIFKGISEDPQRDFTFKIKPYYFDVIEKFMISFTNMHSKIKSLYMELISSLEEQKIYSRQLKELNEKLEEKVSERTRELELKNEELENINNLLKKYNRFLDHILESVLDGILICNSDGKVFKVNGVFFKLFGLNKELEISNVDDVKLKLKKNIEEGVIDKIFTKDFSNLDFIFKDYVEVKIGKEKLNYFCYSSPVVVDSTFFGRLWMFRDETKEKRLKDEIINKNQELKSFIHIISHDLKNPIAVMLGVIELFKESQIEKLDRDAREQVRMMEVEAKIMLKLIEDILQFSRLQNFDFEIEEVDVFQIVDEIVAEFQYLYENIDVVFFVQPDLPKIAANKSLIEQVFKNLISNAVKYYDPEKPRPEVEIGYYFKDGFHHFFVKDNGIGISKEDLPHIFEQFYRVGEKDIEGTGLGMSIVKKIIETFGGKIWIESEKGEYTKVTFTIPEKV